MKKNDTIPGIVITAFGLIAIAYILSNPKLPIISQNSNGVLGNGFYSFVCAVGFTFCGLLLTLRGLKQKDTVDYFQMTPEKLQNFKTIGKMVALLALLLVLWKVTNLFLILLPFYIFGINMLLKRSWKFSLIFAIVFSAFIIGLFYFGFTIQFNV